jgi:hypothetical protein
MFSIFIGCLGFKEYWLRQAHFKKSILMQSGLFCHCMLYQVMQNKKYQRVIVSRVDISPHVGQKNNKADNKFRSR